MAKQGQLKGEQLPLKRRDPNQFKRSKLSVKQVAGYKAAIRRLRVEKQHYKQLTSEATEALGKMEEGHKGELARANRELAMVSADKHALQVEVDFLRSLLFVKIIINLQKKFGIGYYGRALLR